jgi:hypothetical protein
MRALLVALLAVSTAACANATKLETRTEALLHVSIVATENPGALRFTDHYDTSMGPDGVVDCGTAASDGNSAQRKFVIVSPGSKRAPLYFSIQTREFSGPGVYRDGALLLDSMAAVVARRSVDFFMTPASHVVLTLDHDGSGSASFSGYRSTAGATLAARLTWTCSTKTVLWPESS